MPVLRDQKEFHIAEWEQLVSSIGEFSKYSPTELDNVNFSRFMEITNECHRIAEIKKKAHKKAEAKSKGKK